MTGHHRNIKLELFISLAAAFLLTVLFTFPWVPNARTAPTCYGEKEVSRTYHDATFGMVALYWSGQHPERFYEAPFLLPLSAPLAAMDFRLTEGFWTIPLARLFSPPIAWGLYIWIALALTAWGTYWAGRWFTGSAWGGTALAVFFAFGPYRAIHVYHSEIVFAPFLPLSLAALGLYAERPGPRRGVMLGLLVALAAIEHFYVAVPLFTMLLPALLVGQFMRRFTWSQSALPLGVALLASALMLWPAVRFYLDYHASLDIVRSIDEVDWRSADIAAWLNYSPDRFPCLFPGFILVILGLGGLHQLWRKTPELVVAGLVAFLLSFGTLRLLVWNAGLDPFDWPSPYDLLHRFVVPFRALRGAYRHGNLAHLVLAFAAAGVVAHLAARGRRWRIALGILLVLAFLESRWPMHAVVFEPARYHDPSYAWLAAQDGEFAVVDAPMELEQDLLHRNQKNDVLWAAMVHGHPMPNGSMSMDYPWHESISVHLNRPRPGLANAILRALGVRYVVARDSETAKSFEAIGLKPVFYSPFGSVILENDTFLSIPRTPAALQERLIDVDHAPLTEMETGLIGQVTMPKILEARAGNFILFQATVENTGARTWCGNGSLFGNSPRGDIILSLRCIRGLADGAESVPLNLRGKPLAMGGPLPVDVAPGETATVPLRGHAPRQPGLYQLEFDLMARKISWFNPPDSPLATMTLSVTP